MTKSLLLDTVEPFAHNQITLANNVKKRTSTFMFIPFDQRGPQHEGIETIKTVEPLYEKLMSYYYYLLIDEQQKLRTSSLNLVYKYLKELKLVSP